MTDYITSTDSPQDTVEQWRDIPGYEGRYQASNLGRIRSNRRWKHPKSPVWKIRKTTIHRHTRYEMVSFTVKFKASTHYVHRLVMYAFHGPQPDMEVNHINGIRADNRLENLEYCTHTENQRHSWNVLNRKPSIHLGEDHPFSILTEIDVREIRHIAKTKSYSYKELGEQYGVDPSTIYGVIKRKTWKHV